MEAILQIIIITALLSIVINTLLKKYDLPPIIGYIIAGTFVTYIFSLRESHLHILNEIAEFGIAFLMFTIGLEFSINNFKRLKKEVFLFGTLQVTLSTTVFGLFAFYFFDLNSKTSIVIGCALALSSTAIVLKLLNENRDIKKGYGRAVLGILLLQDLAVIPILLMISFFSTTQIPLETMFINTVTSAIIVLAILYGVGKYLLTPFLNFVFDAHSQEIFIGSVLLIAISSSFVAYSFGFSYSLGAFIGGMLLSETPFKHQIEADLTPFRDLLLGVFFVTVGMQVSVSFLTTHIVDIFAIMSVIMVFKATIIFVILLFFASKSNALKSAITLSQVGEFSFVVLELARISGITSKDINQTLIIAVVFSMILTPFILRYSQFIVEKILHSHKHSHETVVSSGLDNHIVVLGYGNLGQNICRGLKEKAMNYLVIDDNRKLLQTSKDNHDPFILGNARQKHILSSANVKNASAVIIAVKKDEDIARLIESISHISSTANIIVSSRNGDSMLIHDKRIRFFVHEHKEIAESMILHALTCDISA